jgi:GT2 family glycosyltransferase
MEARGSPWDVDSPLTLAVPIHGQLAATRRLLESFERQTRRCGLVLIDDQSPDESAAWLRGAGYAVDAPGERLWFNGCFNRALERCRTPWLGVLNNDLVLGREFVERTLEAFERTRCDLLTPRVLRHGRREELDAPRRFRVVRLIKAKGWCMLFRTEAIRSLPPIPAQEMRMWWGDTWVFHHAWERRLRMGMMLHVPVLHGGSTTINAELRRSDELRAILREDTRIRREKYPWLAKKHLGLYRLVPAPLRSRVLPQW